MKVKYKNKIYISKKQLDNNNIVPYHHIFDSIVIMMIV